MQGLRHARRLTRLVLVWFALSIGLAVASPMVNPKAMALVCSSSGGMQFVVQGDDDGSVARGHTLDCPLCATLAAPPPPPASGVDVIPPSPLAHALRPRVAAHIAAATAPPLPSRGPPATLL